MIELNTSHLNNKLRISGIVDESIVDGPGIRLTVFTQGCSHNCPGCHNPDTHDYNGGQEILIQDIIKMVEDNPLLDGITISGGEPFDQVDSSTYLAKSVREMGLNVVIYSGYDYEYLLSQEKYKKLLLHADILVDGKFDIKKKDLTLPFRGSSNQRIIELDSGIIAS